MLTKNYTDWLQTISQIIGRNDEEKRLFSSYCVDIILEKGKLSIMLEFPSKEEINASKIEDKINLWSEYIADADLPDVEEVEFLVVLSEKKTVLKRRLLSQNGKVIMVASGKGGVGKSTMTVILALGLNAMGYKVGIVDADIYGPSIPHIFGLKQSKKEESEQKFVSSYKGIKYVSAALMTAHDKPLAWRGPMVSKMLRHLLVETVWSEEKAASADLDFLLIDTPPGTGDVHLSILESYHIDGVVLVSTIQEIAVLPMLKSANMVRQMGVKIFGVIANMVNIESIDGHNLGYFGDNALENHCNEAKLEVLAHLPLVANWSQNGGVLSFFDDKKTRYSKIFLDLISKISCTK